MSLSGDNFVIYWWDMIYSLAKSIIDKTAAFNVLEWLL